MSGKCRERFVFILAINSWPKLNSSLEDCPTVETIQQKVGITTILFKNKNTVERHFQLMSSHECRRSFATNTYGKLPTPLIMQVTAHSPEKCSWAIIGKSSMDYAQQIADFYAKEAQKDIY